MSGVRRFVIAPFNVKSRRMLAEKKPLYEAAKMQARQMLAFKHKGAMFADFLQDIGLARKRRYGLVIDLLRVADSMHSNPVSQMLWGYYNVQNPNTVRAAYKESLKLVRQLRNLGFPVSVQQANERGKRIFISSARKAGARVEGSSQIKIPMQGMSWARDQWVKIEGNVERPKADNLASFVLGPPRLFGEGGSMVQVGPKEFAVSEELMHDPRVRHYQSKGYSFQPMPGSIVFDKILTDLFGAKIYTIETHIDSSIGGIPEKKIAAVDPHYYSEHRLSVEFLEKHLGVKLVFVPASEADRHPANFLPLGEGRVLVDSGAQEFIKELRQAGATVIPTAVPLDHLIELKGGLHCLFNEK